MSVPINAYKINEEMKRERSDYSSLRWRRAAPAVLWVIFMAMSRRALRPDPWLLKHTKLQHDLSLSLPLPLFLSFFFARHESIPGKRRKLRGSIDLAFPLDVDQ